MAGLARAVAAGVPHHVTQRGNRRQTTFFGPDDYALYRELLATWCPRHDVAVWAWCLMPNPVHLLLVPADAAGLRLALGEAHRDTKFGDTIPKFGRKFGKFGDTIRN